MDYICSERLLTEPDYVACVETDNNVYSLRRNSGKVHVVARRICREIYSRQRFLGGGTLYIQEEMHRAQSWR